MKNINPATLYLVVWGVSIVMLGMINFLISTNIRWLMVGIFCGCLAMISGFGIQRQKFWAKALAKFMGFSYLMFVVGAVREDALIYTAIIATVLSIPINPLFKFE